MWERVPSVRRSQRLPHAAHLVVDEGVVSVQELQPAADAQHVVAPADLLLLRAVSGQPLAHRLLRQLVGRGAGGHLQADGVLGDETQGRRVSPRGRACARLSRTKRTGSERNAAPSANRRPPIARGMRPRLRKRRAARPLPVSRAGGGAPRLFTRSRSDASRYPRSQFPAVTRAVPALRREYLCVLRGGGPRPG